MRYINNETLDYMLRSGEHWIRKDIENYIECNVVKELPLKPGTKSYKIGIIIPNYNYSEWLDKSIGSILNQTYSNYEIIFIDDMSTDNSYEKAKQLIGNKGKAIKLKQRRYNGGARNEGYLYLSDVDYVWYIDSDDWIPLNALETINQNLQGNPDVLFVGIGTDIRGINASYYVPDYKDKYEAIKGWSGSSGKVIKKDLAIKCLYPEGTLKEDRTQHYKVCIEMNSYRCIREILYYWNRNNTKSVTTERNIKWKSDTIRNWADSVEMYETYKGKDIKIDEILLARVENCKNEVLNNEDSQQ